MPWTHLLVAILFWGSLLLVAYVWVGYPLLVALLASLRPPRREVPEPAEPPTVTLLISAWQEEEAIARRLDDALGLDYPPHRMQIVVAAEPSPDRTLEIVRSYADRGVELSTAAERTGKSAAIARALALARGEVVAFSDANNRWNREALRFLVAPFADPRVGATVGAKQVAAAPGHVAAGGALYWRYEDFVRRQESRLSSCLAANGEILAVRRSLMPQIPTGTLNDDLFLVLAVARGGHRVAYVPAARSVELTTLAASDERERRAAITAGRMSHLADVVSLAAAGRPLLAWQFLSHKLLRLALPWALLALLATSLVAVTLPPVAGRGPWAPLATRWAWAALVGQVAIYAIAAAGPRLPRGSMAARLAAPVRYLVEANLATARGTLRGHRQSALWTKAGRGSGPPPSTER